MAKILCAAFLLGLKADNDSKFKASTIHKIGENLQGQVVAFATKGSRFIQAQSHTVNNGVLVDTKTFLDEHFDEVLTALRTNYFDNSVKVEGKKMIRNPDARGTDPLWIDLETLPPVHHLRSGWQLPEYIFEITW